MVWFYMEKLKNETKFIFVNYITVGLVRGILMDMMIVDSYIT